MVFTQGAKTPKKNGVYFISTLPASRPDNIRLWKPRLKRKAASSATKMEREDLVFKLATVYDWWDTTMIPELNFLKGADEINSILKCIGYAFVIGKILEKKPRTIIEFGHGHTSPLFDLFAGNCEMWGIDDTRVDYVTAKQLSDFRIWHRREHDCKFLEAYLGETSSELPPEHFDIVCSVSTVEHIPKEQLPKVFKEISRILAPGGLVLNSYDVHYGMVGKHMFRAHQDAGLEWLEADTEPVLDWDAKDVCFEDARNVMNHFMAYLPENERTAACWPGNCATVLMGASKQRG